MQCVIHFQDFTAVTECNHAASAVQECMVSVVSTECNSLSGAALVSAVITAMHRIVHS